MEEIEVISSGLKVADLIVFTQTLMANDAPTSAQVTVLDSEWFSCVWHRPLSEAEANYE